MNEVLWSIGFVVIGTLLVFGAAAIWNRIQKGRRILTEGTVTLITRETKTESTPGGYVGGVTIQSGTASWVEVMPPGV